MPDLFSHILDQSEPIDQIMAAYRSQRLPHGVIFAGPVGVGKATTAKALAKFFLCDEGIDAYGMGLIDADTHPDYHRITKELVRLTSKTSKATTLSIDVIRDHLVAPAMKKSVTGKGKVFVVEESDLMQPAAQNALLKTLEEPAGRTLIILLTPWPDDLLSTIRSRAQVFRFGQLKDRTVYDQLKLRDFDPKLSETATRLVDGSLGMAIKWIEDGVVEQARDLLSHLDGLLMGRPTADIGDWIKSAAEAYAAKQIDRDSLSSKDNGTRNGIAIYLKLASRHLRAALSQVDDEETLESLCQAIDAINRCEVYLSGNVNIALALLQLGSTLSSLLSPAQVK